MNKIVNQKAWFFVLPVVALVAFNAIIPLMTVVNYSVQEILRRQRLLLGRRAAGSRRFSTPSRFHASLLRQLLFTAHRARHRDSARPRHRAAPCRAAAPGFRSASC